MRKASLGAGRGGQGSPAETNSTLSFSRTKQPSSVHHTRQRFYLPPWQDSLVPLFLAAPEHFRKFRGKMALHVYESFFGGKHIFRNTCAMGPTWGEACSVRIPPDWSVPILVSPFPIQLLVNVPGKAAD